MRDLFRDTVRFTCPGSVPEAVMDDLTAALWSDPTACPSFRLSFEAACFAMSGGNSEWTINRFWDQRHICAIPYVEAFVGADRGVRAAVESFDRAAGLSYGRRLFPKIEGFFNSLGAGQIS